MSEWGSHVKVMLDGFGYYEVGVYDENEQYLGYENKLWQVWYEGSKGVLVTVRSPGSASSSAAGSRAATSSAPGSRRASSTMRCTTSTASTSRFRESTRRQVQVSTAAM